MDYAKQLLVVTSDTPHNRTARTGYKFKAAICALPATRQAAMCMISDGQPRAPATAGPGNDKQGHW
jgi:hypothetical protein